MVKTPGSRSAATLFVMLAVGCTGSDDPAEEVATLCQSVVDLHNEIIDAANDMSSREVGASPTDRAIILSDGFDRMIDIGAAADLPTDPAALTAGMEERRDQIVAELRTEAAAFRNTWRTIDQDERRSTVNSIFLHGEKLMSETEPRITADTPEELIDLVRNTDPCRFVVQLPPAS